MCLFGVCEFILFSFTNCLVLGGFDFISFCVFGYLCLFKVCCVTNVLFWSSGLVLFYCLLCLCVGIMFFRGGHGWKFVEEL